MPLLKNIFKIHTRPLSTHVGVEENRKKSLSRFSPDAGHAASHQFMKSGHCAESASQAPDAEASPSVEPFLFGGLMTLKVSLGSWGQHSGGVVVS